MHPQSLTVRVGAILHQQLGRVQVAVLAGQTEGAAPGGVTQVDNGAMHQQHPRKVCGEAYLLPPHLLPGAAAPPTPPVTALLYLTNSRNLLKINVQGERLPPTLSPPVW